MRNLSPGIAVLFVALILGGCVKPTGITEFLDDERVQNIIGSGVKIEFDSPEDIEPDLEWDRLGTWVGIVELGTVDVARGTLVTIRVKNASVYDTLVWYLDGDNPTPVTGGQFVLDTSTWGVGSHITVEGRKDGVPYGIVFFVNLNI